MPDGPPDRARNLSVAGVAGLTGFLGLAVVMCALFTGMWVDAQLGLRGPATVCLLVSSVPASLALMVVLTLRLISQIDVKPMLPGAIDRDQTEEE
jgi:hypothetical protein